MSSKIDNIYMYMPIILKSMSLYAISTHTHTHLHPTPAQANVKHPDYIKRDHQVCSPRSLVILYTTLVPESTSIFTTEFKG